MHQINLNRVEFKLNYTTIGLLIFFIVITFYLFSFKGLGKGENDIDINQVKEMMVVNDSLVLLDVRTHKEFIGEEGHRFYRDISWPFIDKVINPSD